MHPRGLVEMKLSTSDTKFASVSIGVVSFRSALFTTFFVTKSAMIEFPPDSLAGTIFDGYIKEFSLG